MIDLRLFILVRAARVYAWSVGAGRRDARGVR